MGTVCKTDVLNKTPKTLAIREVLGNKFGVGNSTFRTGITEEQDVDTVPFGCWRREVFEKYGLYDVRLVRNQDIELNKRIKRGGGKIYILPDTYCTYLARETWSALAKNNYGNGKWNILTVWYTKMFSSLSIAVCAVVDTSYVACLALVALYPHLGSFAAGLYVSGFSHQFEPRSQEGLELLLSGRHVLCPAPVLRMG